MTTPLRTEPIPNQDQVTVAAEEATPTLSPLPARIGPYSVISLLGRGGMGSVYLAYDANLQRRLAVKVVQAAHQTRLAQEALLQARVEHPVICRVYQVGEDQTVPYIAMQYIRGLDLASAAKELSPRDIVYLMIPVVDGVHAAHREGLIHRDLKPANILVERDEAGGLHPYVVDFGLARDWEEGGLTQPGMAVGSPSYMAPEQARGEEVDPRTDVYGLGATLYELLTGAPPFLGKNAADTLLQVLEKEPSHLGRVRSDLPEDLQSIVHKCLEKQSGQRYANAKELREDLQRFLDGEPILARQPGPLERAKRLVLRHKLASALTLSTFLFLMCLLAMWAWNRYQTQQQMHVADRYGQEFIQMESILRYGHMLPLHDTAEERRFVVQRMDAIRKGMPSQSRAVQAPGHLALGRGHLLLGEPAMARNEIQKAWDAGYRAPEVQLVLGQTLTELYFEARQQVDSIPDSAKRAEKMRELQQRLRNPAQQHFLNARNQGSQFTAREEARLAFVEERYDDAVTLAKRAFTLEPWRYEALVDAAMGLTWSAAAHRSAGHIDQARQALERSLELLEIPLRIAPSDDHALAVLRRTWAQGNYVGLKGLSSEACAEKALEIQKQVLRAVPNSILQRLEMAKLHKFLGYFAMLRREDPEPHWTEAWRLAETATGDADLNLCASAHEILASLAANRLVWAATMGEVISETHLQQARAHGEAAIQTNHASWQAYQALGRTYLTLGQIKIDSGLDATEEAEKAEIALRTTLELAPSSEVLQVLSGALVLRSKTARAKGLPGISQAEEAQRIANKALALDQKSPDSILARGLANYSRGDAEADGGLDPISSWQAAINDFEQALNLNPNSLKAAFCICAVDLCLARWEIQKGKDPRVFLDACQQCLEKKALAIAKRADIQIEHFRWEMSMLRILYQARRTKSVPEPPLAVLVHNILKLPAGTMRPFVQAEHEVATTLLLASCKRDITHKRAFAKVFLNSIKDPSQKFVAMKELLGKAEECGGQGLTSLPTVLWDNQVFQAFRKHN